MPAEAHSQLGDHSSASSKLGDTFFFSMAFGDKLSTKATQIVAQLPFAGCDACAECLRAKGVFDCAKQCGDCVDEGWASICSVWLINAGGGAAGAFLRDLSGSPLSLIHI